MRTCVYTAVFGRYDGLLEPGAVADSGSDHVCFTDDPTLVSEGWEVRVVESAFGQDPVRSARLIKILGHDSLSDYDATLYIDASVRLHQAPEAIIEEWLGEGDEMALARHSYRDHLIDEFDEVIRLNYDDRARVYEQLVDYAVGYPAALEMPPHWTGMMVRRQTPPVRAAMRTWANHVLRYSRRDQLSVMVALAESGVRYRSVELDNFRSELHEWPVIDRRRVALGKASALPAGPMVAELRRDRLRIAELEQKAAIASAAAEEAVAQRVDLERRLGDAERRAAEGERRLHAVSGIRGATVNLRRATAARLRRPR